MRVSLNWIKRLLGVDDLGISGQDLMDLLSRRVGEIDGLSQVGGTLDGVVVGKVLSCTPHPNADRLRCCTVDIGTETLPIVCGAPNVAAEQTVAVATVGSTLSMVNADGSAQQLTIKKGKLRGEASHGMICAEDELGLGTSHDGILVLDPQLTAGTPLRQALGLGDEVLEIDNHNINHRPDLWGHIGWAREIAACLDLPFEDPCDAQWRDEPCAMDVEINTAGCTTYCGALLTGLRNEPSPAWMVQLLEAVGSRSRGLLVDITNLVMLEVGEPMHAFDRRAISGDRLLVREARSGETITTLDERSHNLRAGDLLIADAERPLALAGIMGGAGSMVTAETTAIVLEAAVFAPERIRHTRLAIGGGTDSSSRFEKGLPPEAAVVAINRAIALLTEIQPNLQVQGRFHRGATSAQRPVLRLSTDLVRRLGGVDIAAERQQQLLQKLGIKSTDGTSFQVPWWRHKDLSINEDLVEEVLRLHGYEHLIEEAPRMPVRVPTILSERSSGALIRRRLAASGWDEVQTYVFTDPRWVELLAWPAEEVVTLVNAPAADQAIMRRSLIAPLLEAAARNRRYCDTVRCYELGRVYGVGIGQGIGDGSLRDEQAVLAGIATGINDEAPFYAARDAALAALAALGLSGSCRGLSAAPPHGLVAQRSAELVVDNQVVGVVGEVQRELRQAVDLDERAAVFELRLGQLLATVQAPPPQAFVSPSRFQQVQREFTWLCPEAVTYEAIAQAMAQGAKQLCQGVELVTIYRGDPIPDGHKALSMRLTLGSHERTLGEKDLQKVHKGVVAAVERQTAARLRG